MRHATAVSLHGIAFATSSSTIKTALFQSAHHHHHHHHQVITNPHPRLTTRRGNATVVVMGSSTDPSTSSSSSLTTNDDDHRHHMNSGSSSGGSRILPPHILSRIEKFASARGGGDALFGYVERCHVNRSSSSSSSSRSSHDGDRDDHGDAPSSSSSSTVAAEEEEEDASHRHCFGDVLDAGTGSHSLRWMASVLHRDGLMESIRATGGDAPSSDYAAAVVPRVSMRSYTAITADENMRRRVYDEARELDISDRGEIIMGNWTDETLLRGRYYDTILVDYLIGAIDGFSPYFQDMALSRLGEHLAPGGRMYVIGLQPVPDNVTGDANVFCKITRVRDACILLAGHRCYREYPLDWIERHIRMAGLDVIETKTYPIRYDHATMVRQINVGRSKLKFFPSRGIAREMGAVLDGLERESLEVTSEREGGRITLGFDYVVVAEKPRANKEEGTTVGGGGGEGEGWMKR
ncbi:hypothetical protein ACHAXA_010938 [Cyclostephanos tholiformis]|uniref:S-adenosyl-L-methionine-dependent methyltransferase n=1 Tax=Cyclostephanos tholiformis TaxID=382380 RepID=A0ABD3R714_9STRA